MRFRLLRPAGYGPDNRSGAIRATLLIVAHGMGFTSLNPSYALPLDDKPRRWYSSASKRAQDAQSRNERPRLPPRIKPPRPPVAAAGSRGAASISAAGSNGGTGGINITGTLEVNNNSALGSAAVTLNGGKLDIAEFSNLSFHNNFYVNKTGGLIFLNMSRLTLSGIIADGDGPGLLRLMGLDLAPFFFTFSGINTYSGGTLLIGALRVTNNSAAGTGTITFDVGYGKFLAGADNLSINNDFKLNYYDFLPGIYACGYIASNGFTLTLSGTIADGNGSAGITFGAYPPGDSGITILTGTNSYTGGTLIGRGETLQLGNGGTSGSILGNVKNEAGTLAFNRSDTYAFNGLIADSFSPMDPSVRFPGKVAQVGTGTTVLNGVNTYTAGTTISAGALQVTNGSSVGPGTVALNGGTFQAGADNLEFPNAFTITTADGKIDTNGHTLTIAGVIADGNGPGALTKNRRRHAHSDWPQHLYRRHDSRGRNADRQRLDRLVEWPEGGSRCLRRRCRHAPGDRHRRRAAARRQAAKPVGRNKRRGAERIAPPGGSTV